MRLVQHLQLLLLQLLLIHSYGRSEEVPIPWNSNDLLNGNTFSVLLGDKMTFKPCGDSNGTNLVYTNNKTVFDQCVPGSDLPSGTLYNEIGACTNPSGQLILPVNTGIQAIGFVAFEVNESYYFLSNYMSECENGLKAIIVVVETRPSPDPTTTGTTGLNSPCIPTLACSTGNTPNTTAGVNPTSGPNSPDDGGLDTLLVPVAAGAGGVILIVVSCVFTVVFAVYCGYKYKKMSTEDLEMQKESFVASPAGEVEKVHTLSSKSYDTATSSFQPEKHQLLSVETDGDNPDTKLKDKDISPVSPSSLPAKTNASSKPRVKTRPVELSSLPPKPSLSKPRHNQVDAATNSNSGPSRVHAPRNPNVAQSLPPIGGGQKPAIGAKPERMKSPTRAAPKPPPKSTATNGDVRKKPLYPPQCR